MLFWCCVDVVLQGFKVKIWTNQNVVLMLFRRVSHTHGRPRFMFYYNFPPSTHTTTGNRQWGGSRVQYTGGFLEDIFRFIMYFKGPFYFISKDHFQSLTCDYAFQKTSSYWSCFSTDILKMIVFNYYVFQSTTLKLLCFSKGIFKMIMFFKQYFQNGHVFQKTSSKWLYFSKDIFKMIRFFNEHH